MGMAGYTKLFSSILASTIWREDDKTRIVWITLLAMSDKDGIADGSVPGLADFARVSVDDCRAALNKLASPDADSRSKEYEGRRIEIIDGGWRILNHAKYRSKLNEDERREYLRKKQAEHRAKAGNVNTASTGVNIGQQTSTPSTHAEADTEADPFKIPASPVAEKEKASKEEKPKLNIVTPEHAAFIAGWTQNFKAQFGFDYAFKGGRDGKAVKELLRGPILRIDILEIAKSAWKRAARSPKSFNCEQATTISGFQNYFNQIRADLQNENPHSNPASNARNAVMSQGTNHRTAAELIRMRNDGSLERERAARLAATLESERLSAAARSVAGEMAPPVGNAPQPAVGLQ